MTPPTNGTFRLAGPLALTLGLCALGGAVLFSLAQGSVDLAAGEILSILAQRLGLGTFDGPAWYATVIWEVRLPRVLTGALVGGGLALCGTALQGLFRNPLASPGVLGVTGGAALGAVLAFYAGWASASVWVQPLLATATGGATAFVVYGLATRRGHTAMGTLLLAGIAFASLTGALTSLIVSLALANYKIGSEIVFWTLGGLDGRTWDHVWLCAPPVLLGSALVMACARDLDALLLGEAQAASVGVDVPRVRRWVIAATSLITGTAVAVSGAVAFVGLIIPHMLRRVLGPGHRLLLPASMLAGAVFVILADVLARTLIAPEELRLGVLTAAVGAPFFLWLLWQQRREGRW